MKTLTKENKGFHYVNIMDQGCLLYTSLFEEFCDNVYIATDDGSLGTKGFVTTVLEAVSYTHLDVYKRQVLY